MSKTVNFLEALEANKTKRIRFVNGGDWISVGSYRDSVNRGYGGMLEAIEGQWQVEPEVIEFECEVFRQSKHELPTIRKYSCSVDKMDSILNKKVKVRIEVLGDE